MTGRSVIPSGVEGSGSLHQQISPLPTVGRNDKNSVGLPSHFGIDHHPGPGPEGNLVQDGGLVLYAVPGKGKLT